MKDASVQHLEVEINTSNIHSYSFIRIKLNVHETILKYVMEINNIYSHEIL